MKIEKGKPIPENKPGKKTDLAYQVEKLEVGDCIFLSGVFSVSDNCFNRVKKQMQRLGFRPAARKQEDGYRLWRTK